MRVQYDRYFISFSYFAQVFNKITTTYEKQVKCLLILHEANVQQHSFLIKPSWEENYIAININMFQSIRALKTRLVLTIKYISISKETLKLLLNIRIILSSNKIQLLQKHQFVN